METNLKILIGKRIRFCRKNADLSQAELAEKIDSSSNYIGELERAEKNVSIEILGKITSALGISLSEFFLNISTDTFDEQNTEINAAYQLLLSLPKDKQKLACNIIENIVKMTEK